MNKDSQGPGDRNGSSAMGGGGPLALLTIAGTVVGGLLGQPSIGLLVGLALGMLVALYIWLR